MYVFCLKSNYTKQYEKNMDQYQYGGDKGGVLKMKVTQSCLTLCNPMDYTVH